MACWAEIICMGAYRTQLSNMTGWNAERIATYTGDFRGKGERRLVSAIVTQLRGTAKMYVLTCSSPK